MKRKILVVEDGPLNMRLLEMTLGAGSYILLEAKDGEEALNIAVRELPDLIIMDIQIPVMDGMEVTRKLREMPVFCNTPVSGITACAMKGDREKVLDSGCDEYLSKPINTRELPGLIDSPLSANQG